MGRKSASKWNLFFNYFSMFISIANGFLIVPLYIKFIGSELYGLWLATGNIIAWLTLIDPGIGDLLQQRTAFYFGKKDNLLVSKTVTAGIILSLILCLLAYIFSRAFLYFLPEIVNIKITLKNAVLLKAFNYAAIGTSLQLFSFGIVAVNLGLLRAIAPGIIYISSSIISIVINIFLLFNGYGLMAIGIVQLINGFLILAGNGIYFIFVAKKENIKFYYDFKYIRSFSKIFSYTFGANISGQLAQNIDLILVARFLSPESVTMLELTRRPMKVLQSLTNRPSVAIKPAFSHLWGEGQKEKAANYLTRITNILLVISFFVAGGFVLFNKSLIGIWVGHENYIGNQLNLILVINYFILFSIAYNSSNFVFAIGEIKKYSFGIIAESILFLLLLYLLGKYYRLWGIVISMGISFFATTFWYFPTVLYKKINFSEKQLKEIFFTILISTIIFIISIIISDKVIISNWSKLIIFSLIYSIIYFFIQFIINKSFQMEIIGLLKYKFAR